MIGGKINGNFSVLMYENGEAYTRVQTTDAGEVALSVKSVTKFPANGVVDYSIDPSTPATFTINFRVPQWSANFKAKIGTYTYAGKKSELLSITRKWNAGDKVEITFDMPVEVLSGGLSYPDAIKRGPQVLAVDKGLNGGIGKFGTLTFANDRHLTDADAALPADWTWKEAFYLDAKVNNIPQKVVLVPFAEAGQKTADLEVWIRR
jgi:DUF1680 family protein